MSWDYEVEQRDDGAVFARPASDEQWRAIRMKRHGLFRKPSAMVKDFFISDAVRLLADPLSDEVSDAVTELFGLERQLARADPNVKRCLAVLLSRALKPYFPEAADALESAGAGAAMCVIKADK